MKGKRGGACLAELSSRCGGQALGQLSNLAIGSATCLSWSQFQLSPLTGGGQLVGKVEKGRRELVCSW